MPGMTRFIDWMRVPPVPWPAPLLAAVALVFLVVGWRWPHPGTIAHEMGHAVLAWVTGRQVCGITVHSDTSGVTTSRGRPRGLGMLLVVLAGYPAPLLVAAGLTWLWRAGWGGAGVALIGALLAGAFLLIRSWFGGAVLTAGLAVVAATVWSGLAALRAVACLAVAAWLIGAGVRGVTGAWRVRRSPRPTGSDAEQARTLSHLPQVLWLALFTAVAIAAAGWFGYATTTTLMTGRPTVPVSPDRSVPAAPRNRSAIHTRCHRRLDATFDVIDLPADYGPPAGRAGGPVHSGPAVNQVISKRMVKKQQMRWSPRGAHLLLQIRTRVLNDTLADDYRRWYPDFTHTPQDQAA